MSSIAAGCPAFSIWVSVESWKTRCFGPLRVNVFFWASMAATFPRNGTVRLNLRVPASFVVVEEAAGFSVPAARTLGWVVIAVRSSATSISSDVFILFWGATA